MAHSTSDYGVRSSLGSSTLSAALSGQASKLASPRSTTMGQSSGENFISQSPAPEEKHIRYTLPNEDHIYANCGDTMRFRELASEVENLKSLLLLHLDLIQQQSECIALKDKHLASLRQENETLKMRIERMERRISLQLQRQKSEPPEQENVPAQNNNNNNKTNLESAPDARMPETSDLATSQPNDVACSLPRKRIKTLLPVRAPAGSNKSRDANKSTQCAKQTLADNVTLENHKDDLLSATDVKNTVKVYESSATSQSVSETLTLQGLKKTPKSATREQACPSVTPEHRRIRRLLQQKCSLKEPCLLRKENILTTDEPYPTLVGENLQNTEMNEIVGEQIEIEVPLWCEKFIEPIHDSQGTENLDDEVFAKRHQKHELDEKRRKRWDLQRTREQRQYEKLRARYEGEDRSQDRSSNKTRNNSATISSFWSQPQDVAHLHVDNWLPVNAFGAPLPTTASTDFCLPWTFSSKGTKGDKRKARR